MSQYCPSSDGGRAEEKRREMNRNLREERREEVVDGKNKTSTQNFSVQGWVVEEWEGEKVIQKRLEGKKHLTGGGGEEDDGEGEKGENRTALHYFQWQGRRMLDVS